MKMSIIHNSIMSQKVKYKSDLTMYPLLCFHLQIFQTQIMKGLFFPNSYKKKKNLNPFFF